MKPAPPNWRANNFPDRYPYVYEFRKALELDPGNDALHRELAYLLLAMSEKGAGAAPTKPRQEFKRIVDASPDDYVAAAQLGLLYLAADQNALAMPILKDVLAHADSATANHVRMALKLPLLLEEEAHRRFADSILSSSATEVIRRVSSKTPNAISLPRASRTPTMPRSP